VRAHREAELAPAHRAADGGAVGGLHRLGDVAGGEAEGAQAFGAEVDADLVFRRADEGHARHAGELLEAAGVDVARGASGGAQVAGARHGEDGDGPFPGVASEERGARGLLRQNGAGVVEALADGEHGGRHPGAPREPQRGGGAAVAAHRAQLHAARRGGDGFLDGLRDEARDLGRRGAGVGGADGEDGEPDVGEEGDGQAPQRHAAEEDEGERGGHGRDRAAEGEGGESHESGENAGWRNLRPERAEHYPPVGCLPLRSRRTPAQHSAHPPADGMAGARGGTRKCGSEPFPGGGTSSAAGG